jgi:NitT/TauT family transport system permease protein
VLVGLVGWQVASLIHSIPDYELPSPRAVGHEWWLSADKGLLWHHVWTTTKEALFGFTLAFGASSVTGYAVAKSRILSGLLSPYVAATQAMPILALAPLLIVWFGLGIFSKMLICAVIVFFPILVNIAVGLRSVDRTLLEAAAIDGAGPLRMLFKIEIPLAARTILAGVRMGLTLSMTGAIVAEFIASNSGLGYLMSFARSQYNAPLLFVAALMIVALAVTGYVLVLLLEQLLITWD